MVQLHKTFGFTTLGLFLLMLVGYSSTAFGQEQVVKKKMIIKTIDENGVEQTQVIESEEAMDDILPERFMRGHKAPGMLFFKSDDINNPISKQKKIVVLDEDGLIPGPLQAELQAMGIDLNMLQQQLAAAQKSVHISQEGSMQPTIEIDSDLDLQLPTRMGQPKMKRIIMANPNGHKTMEKEIDVDVDIQNINGAENGTIKLNINGEVQTFNFSGTEVPDEIKQQLKDMGVDLNVLDGTNEEIEINGNGQKRVMIFKSDEEEVAPSGQRKMIWMDKDKGAIEVEENTFQFKEGGNKEHVIIMKKDCADDKSAKCDKNDKCSKATSKSCCEKKQKPRLGVFLEDGVKGKALVQDVVPNSAAYKGGLKEGDVIFAINKKSIGSNQDLIDEIGKYEVGDKIKVKFQRDGKKQKASVTLQAAPARKRRVRHHNMNRIFPEMSHRNNVDCEKTCNTPMLGVMIDENGGKGVHISMTMENSGAQKAGLQKEDILTKIGSQTIVSIADLINFVKSKKPGDTVDVTYSRNGKSQTATATLTSQALLNFRLQCDCSQPDFKNAQGVDSKEIIIIKHGAIELPEMPDGGTVIEQQLNGKRPQLDVQTFNLFPNPNQGTFTVSFELDNNSPITISVVDVTGKEVYREEKQKFSGTFRQQIDISKQAKGVYFFNVIQGEQVFTKQFVYN